MKSPAKKKPPASEAIRPRRCKYCRATFIPARPQDAGQKFCEPNHRKAYNRYGGLPFDKLMERVKKEIKREFDAWKKDMNAKILADMKATFAELLTSYVSNSQAPPTETP